jgi:hypothetical protein
MIMQLLPLCFSTEKERKLTSNDKGAALKYHGFDEKGRNPSRNFPGDDGRIHLKIILEGRA